MTSVDMSRPNLNHTRANFVILFLITTQFAFFFPVRHPHSIPVLKVLDFTKNFHFLIFIN